MIKIVTHFVDFDLFGKNAVIIDAGCSRGEFYRELVKYAPEGKKVSVVGVEPSKNNWEFLNEIKYPKFYRAALVGIGGLKKVEFFDFIGKDGRYHQWGNIYGNEVERIIKRNALQRIDKYEIKTVTLQGILDDVGYIDYLKMDIEGTEDEVIDTMKPVSDKIGQIGLEYHNRNGEILIKKLNDFGFDAEFADHSNEIYARRKSGA